MQIVLCNFLLDSACELLLFYPVVWKKEKKRLKSESVLLTSHISRRRTTWRVSPKLWSGQLGKIVLGSPNDTGRVMRRLSLA